MSRLNIKTLEVSGFASTLAAVHLPMGKDPVYYPKFDLDIHPILEEGQPLQIEEGQPLQIFTSSHIKMTEKELKLLSRLVQSGDQHSKCIRGIQVGVIISAPIWFYRELETYRIGRERLSSESTMHIECKKLSGEELMEAKDKIEMGHIQRTVDTISYQTLRRIYFQRRNHRLPLWHEFCDWIETLPFAKELITITKDERE